MIRAAAEQGKRVAVLADETRPFLQGARLTAWELVKDGIDTTVITDNMAGAMMRLGDVDLVVVGADRIAANGDVANKIGTYSRGGARERARHPVLRRGAAVDDRSEHAGRQRIPIEERSSREVTHVGSSRHDARRRSHPQSGVRRHAGQVRHGDHHRARHRAGRPTTESLAR